MRSLTALPALILSGCTIFATTTFDPVEYDHWIKVAFIAEQSNKNCDQPEAMAFVIGTELAAQHASMYSKNKSHNERIGVAADIVTSMAGELKNRHMTDSSVSYCKLKTEGIAASARAIAASLAKKET